METTAFYQQLEQQTSTQIDENKKQLRKTTIARLMVFGLLVWLIYATLTRHMMFGVPAGITFVGFLWLMKLSVRLNKELTYYKKLHQIVGHAQAPFFSKQTGLNYQHALHPYASDFDIFGEGSVFQYINTTETANGEARLAHLLLNPLTSNTHILQQQLTVKELANKPQFLVDYRTLSALIGNSTEANNKLSVWLQSAPFFSNKKWLPILLWLIPALSIAGIVTAFAVGYFKLLVLAILANWLMVGLYLKRVNQIHALVGKQKDILENFNRLNELVNQERFATETLVELQQSFTQSTLALKQLSKLVSLFDQRLNTMLGPIFNSLFLFDLQCVYRIEKWQQQHAQHMLKWLDNMGHFEALTCLGTYAFNHPKHVYPALSDEAIYFEAEEFLHPLMGNKTGVSNSFKFDQTNNVFIVTGSNMSGKSTFLRATGVSLLTAMLGLPVYAKRFVFSPVKLLSSMRIADSLQDSTSYFHAELKRLKLIMDETESSNLPCVLFIDEMLKGTNSKEKLDGSISIIEKLVTKSAISFIATHDLALGVLEQKFPDKVKNYSFESAIVNNELVFDYKIKPGVAQSTNATFLLKKLEIV